MENQNKKDGYTWADLLNDLQKLTPGQLQNHVCFWESFDPIFPNKLLVPTEDHYWDDNNEPVPLSKLGCSIEEAGDIAYSANDPILIESHE